jgi:hypothetical protein
VNSASPSKPALPIVPAPVLPHGLTVEEAVRIAEAISATHAESTRAVYGCMWSQWERWCQARGVAPMPAAPPTICVYLTDRAAAGVSVGTLDMDCGAISYMHGRHGLPDPLLSEGVRQVRRGLRRLIGAAPRRPARPLQTDDIRDPYRRLRPRVEIRDSLALDAHEAAMRRARVGSSRGSKCPSAHPQSTQSRVRL